MFGWTELEKGEPLPFSNIPEVGIRTIARKPIAVLDWMLVSSYYDGKGRPKFGGFVLFILEHRGQLVKVKSVNPNIIGQLKGAKKPYYTKLVPWYRSYKFKS